MKTTRTTISALTALLAVVPNAFAGETVEVYCSPMLVLTFVGFIALIVVIQLIPAIMTLIGSIKGLNVKESDNAEVVH